VKGIAASTWCGAGRLEIVEGALQHRHIDLNEVSIELVPLSTERDEHCIRHLGSPTQDVGNVIDVPAQPDYEPLPRPSRAWFATSQTEVSFVRAELPRMFSPGIEAIIASPLTHSY
jgi:hypothetical protein